MKMLPTHKELKERGVPASVAYMMYDFYRSLPSNKINAQGIDEFSKNHIKEVVKQLAQVNNIEDLRKTVLLALNIYEDCNIEDLMKDLEDEYNTDSIKKFLNLSNLVGLDIYQMADEKVFESKHYNARIAVGEDPDSIKNEFIRKEYIDNDKEKSEDEEYKEHCRKFDLLNHKKREDWSLVRRMDNKYNVDIQNNELLDEELLKVSQDFANKFAFKEVSFLFSIPDKDKINGIQEMDKQLSSLAESLSVPTTMIGFNGSLSFSYGGACDGSLGTYSPVTHCLYVKKDMTSNVAFHEWFHALDYDLSYKAGTAMFKSLEFYLSPVSDGIKERVTNRMGDVIESVDNLMDYVKNSNSVQNINKNTFLPGNDGQGLFLELIKKVYFQNQVLKVMPADELNSAKKRFMDATQRFHKEMMGVHDYSEYMQSEFERGHLITLESGWHIFDFKGEIAILADAYRQFQKEENPFAKDDSSFFYAFSNRMDSLNRKEYFAKETELFARMGEQYVFDKQNVFEAIHETPAYPIGEEKKQIAVLLDQVIKCAKDFYAKNEFVKRNKNKI